MKKSKTVSKKLLQKLLSEASFNPAEPGPMALLLESNNPEYLRLRAIELTRQSIQEPELKQENLNLAIRLLLMTRALLQNAETVATGRGGKPEVSVLSVGTASSTTGE